MAGAFTVLFPRAGVERGPPRRITRRKAIHPGLVDAVHDSLNSRRQGNRADKRVNPEFEFTRARERFSLLRLAPPTSR